MKQAGNAFGRPDLSTARVNKRLTHPTPLSLKPDTAECWQMAVLGHGMQVRAGAGVGSMQFKIVTAAAHTYDMMLGLVSAEANVVDDRHPGKSGAAIGAGWTGDGSVKCTLPEHLSTCGITVRFDKPGDRVMLVLDCREKQRPTVRILIDGAPALIAVLGPVPATNAQIILCPAIALKGNRYVQGCVELEPDAPLPPGWDGTPS